MGIPTITIRRTNNLTPQGSEVLIDGHKIEGVQGIGWNVEVDEIDSVTLAIKGRVIVEHFNAPETIRVDPGFRIDDYEGEAIYPARESTIDRMARLALQRIGARVQNMANDAADHIRFAFATHRAATSDRAVQALTDHLNRRNDGTQYVAKLSH